MLFLSHSLELATFSARFKARQCQVTGVLHVSTVWKVLILDNVNMSKLCLQCLVVVSRWPKHVKNKSSKTAHKAAIRIVVKMCVTRLLKPQEARRLIPWNTVKKKKNCLFWFDEGFAENYIKQANRNQWQLSFFLCQLFLLRHQTDATYIAVCTF